jgi:hypothetical protein
VIFLLLYAHAYRKREDLDLNELELFDTRRTLEALSHTIVIGLFVVLNANVEGFSRGKPYEDQADFGAMGLFYAYLAFMIYRTRLKGRQRKALIAGLAARVEQGDTGTEFQS